MDDSARSAKLKPYLTAIYVFALYFIAAKLGLKLAFLNASATAVWAPTGIALATFLIFGKRYWPAIFAAAFLANWLTAGNLTTSLIIAGGNTLEGLLGALLINRFANGRKVFERSADILKFVFFAEIISTTVSPFIGVTVLCLGGYGNWNLYWDTWTTWWLGDLTGALIATPFLILWYNNPRVNFRRLPLTLLSFLAVGVVSQAVFGNLIFPNQDMEVEFLCIPPMIWIAYRLGLRESATASVLMCAIALWNTVHGVGPFVLSSKDKSLLLLQVFMSVISMTALALAAAIAERKTAEENLERAHKAEKQLQGKMELIQLLQSITVAANESMTLPEAVQLSLRLICRYLGWPVGHVYYVDQDNLHQMKPGPQWFIRDENKYRNLRKVTDQRVFQPGEGLPGIVFTSASPRWIEDVIHYPNFPRAKMGLDINVGAAFGFPVMIGKNVVAVLEFFTDHPVPPNQDLMENMGHVGTQLGRIIERHQAQQAQSELALLVDTSSDFIVMTNPEGYILYLNEAGRAIVGLEKNSNTRVLRHEDFIFKDDIPKLQNEVIAALMTRGHWEGEFHLKNFKTGKPVPVYFSAGILKDPQTGHPTTLAAIGHNVTDIREAEKTLRESDARFRSVVQSSPNAILTADSDGNILSWNTAAEAIFGFAEQEITGKPFSAILSAKHRETYQLNESLLKKPQGARLLGKTIELQGLRKTGVEFPIELSLSYWKIGDKLYFGGIIRDITERKKMEALLRSNTELQQFANVASHDLQEPLRMVAGFVQLLSEHLKGKLDEDAKEYMGFAVDGAKRMQQLVNGLLEYSRVESRGQSPQAVDMNKIFNETIFNLEMRIAETQAKITHGPLTSVTGDPVQLAQLMQNLFSNALKFKNNRIPEINFSMSETEEKWTFACRDNGIGIEPKYFDRIFVIFQRLHHREEYPGSGIGLAVCKRIVERHGGRMWVESTPDKGSTFFFTLPKNND
jgi:PAS domain S-box-containing protein